MATRWNCSPPTECGAGAGDRPTTALCACAEVNGGTLVLDDRAARRVARRHGLTVRGTVGLVADACRRGRCTVTNASVLVDGLHATGMRLPFPRGGFESWAREKKLLG